MHFAPGRIGTGGFETVGMADSFPISGNANACVIVTLDTSSFRHHSAHLGRTSRRGEARQNGGESMTDAELSEYIQSVIDALRVRIDQDDRAPSPFRNFPPTAYAEGLRDRVEAPRG